MKKYRGFEGEVSLQGLGDLPGGFYRPYTAPTTTTVSAPTIIAQPVRPTSIPYYDPGRIFENIRVVQDLRQQGTERGEIQDDDDALLGPVAVPRPNDVIVGPPKAPAKNPLIPIALAIAAFVLLGE